MVGALIAAGNGKLNQRDIYEMLTIPSKYSWHISIKPAARDGLYLTGVEYSPEVLSNSIQTIDEVTDTKSTNVESNDDVNGDEIKIKN